MADAALRRCGKIRSRGKPDQWQCPRMIPADDPRVLCQHCRDIKNRWSKSDKGKAHFKRRNALPESRAAIEAWRKTPNGIASKKRSDARIMHKLGTSLRDMFRGKHLNPVTLPMLGSFRDNEDAEAHFRDLFEPWMSKENHGKHVAGNGYNVVWNIGHRLPTRIFDEQSTEDLKKCWDRRNLFPQCAKENLEHNDTLKLSDDQLLQLRPLWPAAAMDDLEVLKKLFTRTYVRRLS